MLAITFIQVTGEDDSFCDWDFAGDRTEIWIQMAPGRVIMWAETPRSTCTVWACLGAALGGLSGGQSEGNTITHCSLKPVLRPDWE